MGNVALRRQLWINIVISRALVEVDSKRSGGDAFCGRVGDDHRYCRFVLSLGLVFSPGRAVGESFYLDAIAIAAQEKVFP